MTFGRTCASKIRRRAPQFGDKWHLEEVMISINGKIINEWKQLIDIRLMLAGKDVSITCQISAWAMRAGWRVVCRWDRRPQRDAASLAPIAKARD